MLRTRRLLSAVAVGAAVVLLASGCSRSSGERLTIYSGRSENLIGPLLEQFADETGIGIDVKYGDSADLALLIAEEGDRSPADVFYSQSPGAVGFLDREGRLRPLDGGVLGLVDERFHAADGDWVGVSARVRVLVYNTEMVPAAELPASVFDLTDPRYRGRLAVAPTNGSFQDFVTAMREQVGDDRTLAWLEGIEGNGARAYANNNAIVEAVARGEIAMGLVNHYYNLRHKAEDPGAPTENHIFPNGDVGALLIVSAAAVLESSDRPDDAERLVRFLLTAGAQRFMRDNTFEYPLSAGVEPAEGLPALAGIDTPPVELDSLGGGLERTKELIDQSGLED